MSFVKNKVAARIEEMGRTFDSRVAGALNRLGILLDKPPRPVCPLDELSALLEHVARTQ